MSELDLNKTIPKKVETNDDLDYHFLRKKGIEYIESLGSELWSDYNSHDPGITILEVLSYALTDLAARIELPVEVLLAEEDNEDYLKEQFLTADLALPIKPITPTDYRKLFIDLDGVKNAWVRKHEKKVFANCKDFELGFQPFPVEEKFQKEFILNGLYDFLIEMDELDPEVFNTPAKIEQKQEEIKDLVRATYHANRNLCEDIIDISLVEEHPVQICAQIEVHPEADEEKVHALILYAIDEYLSPNLRFYSLKEMLGDGYTTDKIYNGPLLTNGFLKNEELAATELRTEIRLSDLIHIIQNIEGVDVIRDISIDHCSGDAANSKDWLLCVPEGLKPTRCDKSVFSYFKGFLPLNVDEDAVEGFLQEFRDEAAEEIAATAAESKELDLPNAEGMTLGKFTTIQNDFPEVYGVGQVGINPSLPDSEKSKIKQLKGYLLFFDQILSTYFAQLLKVKELLSIDGELEKSYFTQLVNDVKDFKEILPNDYSYLEPDFSEDDVITDILLSDLDDEIVRRNQILDHLLSRFAENFSDYAYLMKQLYGSFTDQAVIKTKERFLQQYGIIGCERGLSFNYYRQLPEDLWDTNNVSSFQKRIALLSGNPDYSRRNFSDHSLELYEEVDTDGIIEYRFRIKDKNKTILSSGSKHYHNLASLYAEIFNIKNYGRFIENYEIKINKAGRFYFNLTDPNFPDLNDERHVIARRIPSFKTQANAEAAIKIAAEFIAEIDPNEGMFLIEHILLRPDVTEETMDPQYFMNICKDNCESCDGIDPYSFRVSIVLPGWTERYSNIDFRRFMEDLIKRELPSHIMAKICWIGWPASYEVDNPDDDEMVQLEAAYKAWLLAKTDSGQAQDETALIDLYTIMNSLHTIYPQGKLHNCDNEEEQQDIILGRTNLGKI